MSRSVLSLMLAATALTLPSVASAETLQGALAKAYQNNPQLMAARAGQRALDENLPITRSEGLPSVGVTGSLNEAIEGTAAYDRVATIGTSLRVPLFQGGSVRNALKATKERIKGGRADLRGTEADIFAQTTAAYMDVIRDEAIVALNRNQVRVLTTNLRAARDRFEIGDLTRTDVAQSQARLSLAQGQLQAAEARLITSREGYMRLVGEPPVDLQPPPPLPNLPGSHDEAIAVALKNNPDLEAAMLASRAAKYDVGSARGALLPQVSGVASSGMNDYLGTARVPGLPDRNTSAGVQVTLPLFQGGGIGARVRQAQARSAQAMEGEIATERAVIAQTRGLFASWQAALQVIEASKQAVDANLLSLEGVRAENSVGTRTILEILNAEQELLNSQVQLVSARRDAYVAGFNLLAIMGKAEADDLSLDAGPLYDPTANYQRVKGKFFEWDADPAPKPVGTSTAGQPAQTATVSPNADLGVPRRDK